MLIGGFSQSGTGLIASMSLAGLGNAILLPVSQAMLVSEYPENKKSHAIAIWASAIAYAMAIGPLVGGWVSKEFGWQWVFWSVTPIFIICLMLITLFSKESKNTIDPPVGDYKGMVFLGVGLTTFVLATTEFKLFSWVTTLLLFLLAFLAFLGLWKNSKSFSHPILLPELIRKKAFLAASIGSACLVFYMGFICLLISSILQGTLNEFSPISFIVMTLLAFGVGYGLIFGPTATAAISIVPPHKAGIASGTFVTIQEIGGIFGLALVVTTVRLYSPLLIGLQKGGYALIGVSLLGCLASLFLKPRSKKEL